MSERMYMIYLFIGYTIIWGGLFLYVLKLHLDHNKLKKELMVLSEILKPERSRKKKE